MAGIPFVVPQLFFCEKGQRLNSLKNVSSLKKTEESHFASWTLIAKIKLSANHKTSSSVKVQMKIWNHQRKGSEMGDVYRINNQKVLSLFNIGYRRLLSSLLSFDGKLKLKSLLSSVLKRNSD